jgi:hypothetical protein
MKTSEALISQAVELFKRSRLCWVCSERIELSQTSGQCSFDSLRSLEDVGIFVEDINSETETNLQAQYNAGTRGDLSEDSILKLRIPRILSKLAVVKDLNDLLSINGAKCRMPNYCIVAPNSEGKCAAFQFSIQMKSEDVPIPFQLYFRAVHLWNMLDSQDHHKTESGALLFFGLRRIEIAPNYSIKDLAALAGEEGITEIEKFVLNEDRIDTRREIFNSALSEYLKDYDSSDAFGHIVRANDRFARRLREGLALFLSENSPEKLAEEGRRQHFELAEKVEKGIHSVEIKALTVPVALLLIVSQIERGEGMNVPNAIILSAVVVYWVVMLIAHSSHLTTIRILRGRINKAIADLRERGIESGNPLLSEEFASLRTRCRNCYIGAWVVWPFSFVPIVALIYASFLS